MAAADALIVQLPAAVKVRTPELELTVHPVVPALTSAYVIEADPRAVANTEGVAGEFVVRSEVVGAQVTVCELRNGVIELDEEEGSLMPIPFVAVILNV